MSSTCPKQLRFIKKCIVPSQFILNCPKPLKEGASLMTTTVPLIIMMQRMNGAYHITCVRRNKEVLYEALPAFLIFTLVCWPLIVNPLFYHSFQLIQFIWRILCCHVWMSCHFMCYMLYLTLMFILKACKAKYYN